MATRGADWLLDLGAALTRRSRSTGAVVLYYHAVEHGERGCFADQMDALKRLAHPVRADEPGPLDPGRRYAAVTFDDGFVSVVEHALPELEARAIPATLFVPTGCWEQRPCWVKDPLARAFNQTVMSRETLRSVAASPLFTIGAHSVTHAPLVDLPDDAARRELADSKADLEQTLGREVTLFSFPHGRYNARLVELARDVGYRRAFTVSPHNAFRAPDEFLIGRVAADPGDWRAEFHLKLLGAYRWRCYLRQGSGPEPA